MSFHFDKLGLVMKHNFEQLQIFFTNYRCLSKIYFHHNLKPECTAETPHVRFSYSTNLKPAFLIMAAKVSWSGNCLMLSTRYWYESQSPANTLPMGGITWKE